MTYIKFTSRNRNVVISCANDTEQNRVLAIIDAISPTIVDKRPMSAHIRVKADWWLSKV